MRAVPAFMFFIFLNVFPFFREKKVSSLFLFSIFLSNTCHYSHLYQSLTVQVVAVDLIFSDIYLGVFFGLIFQFRVIIFNFA